MPDIWKTVFLFVFPVFVASATAQLSTPRFPPLRLDPTETGIRPLGVDVTDAGDPGGSRYVAVANSGSDSVSLLELRLIARSPEYAILERLATVRGIPAPYAAVFCPGRRELLVTSPGDGSISVIQAPEGSVLARIRTGPQPYSVACFQWGSTLYALVSNAGDSTLSVVNLNTLAVETNIPGVPGARGLRGITVSFTQNAHLLAWIAGTDGNAVTVLDVGSGRIINRLPLRGPMSFGTLGLGLGISVTIPVDNTVVNFDRDTLVVRSRLEGFLLTPQSIGAAMGEFFATTGANNSLVEFSYPGIQPIASTVIPGVPGAAGFAAWQFLSGRVLVHSGLLVTSPDSDRVFIGQRRPLFGTQFSAVHGASFVGDTAPGALASIFFSTGVAQNFMAESLPLPTNLGGVRLLVGGTVSFQGTQPVYLADGAAAVGLLFVGPNQINFQVPPQIAPSPEVFAQLQRPDGSRILGSFSVSATRPGIFTWLSNGEGPAVVLNQDNSENDATHPALRGSIIQIFATGAGATTPILFPGEAAPRNGIPLVRSNIAPQVTIAGRPARVLFSGMAPGLVGVWQINAEVPRDMVPSPPLFVPIQVVAAGLQSNSATIAVQ